MRGFTATPHPTPLPVAWHPQEIGAPVLAKVARMPRCCKPGELGQNCPLGSQLMKNLHNLLRGAAASCYCSPRVLSAVRAFLLCKKYFHPFNSHSLTCSWIHSNQPSRPVECCKEPGPRCHKLSIKEIHGLLFVWCWERAIKDILRAKIINYLRN